MDPASALLALQASDLEIHRMEKLLEELPEKRGILEARHKAEDVRQIEAKATELVSRLERSISANNDEAEGVRGKIAEVQALLDSGSVTNPKEVHNLSREMDALRRRIDKIDNDTIKLMEKLEHARGQAAKIETALEQLARREQDLIASYQQKGGEIQQAREEERSRRADIAQALESALLERYEGIRATKGGIGASRLDDSRCSACRVELPIERVSELRSGPDIGVCPSCRRLLVVRTADDAQ